MSRIIDLVTLAKNSVDSNHFLETSNSSTIVDNKISIATLFPSLATTGTSSENLWVSVTNKNQLNFKGIKSGDTGLLTVATTSNNIVLTALEAGVDLSLCNNLTSGFLSSIDFTSGATGECGVTNGGTGLSTIAKGSVLYADTTDSISAATPSVQGQILAHNTTTGVPSWITLTGGTNTSVVNTAGVITINSTLSTMAAILDMGNYNIDLGTGYLSADGATSQGIRVTADDAYIGAAATYMTTAGLSIASGGITFSKSIAPTIKNEATTGGTSGTSLTIESGSSAGAAAGNLLINGGTASGTGAGGSIVVTAGRDTGGSNDGNIQLKTYTSSTATAGLTIGAEGQNVTVETGNVIIKTASKGLVHAGSGTVTQATSHSTGVTLNTTSGIITLANVALNAAAEADFAVTNSSVQAEAVILLTVQSPASASAVDNASLHAELDDISNGSFNIRLSNPGAANTAGVHKIHFLIINPAIS